MSIVAFKLLAAAIFAVGLVGGLIPLFAAQYGASRFFSLGNALVPLSHIAE